MNEESKITSEAASKALRVEKITSVEKTKDSRTKDPRRVEAGKRLGMISKQVKERKARERSEAESQAHEAEREWFPWVSEAPVVGVIAVACVTGLVLYTMSKKYKTIEVPALDTSESASQNPNPNQVNQRKPKRVYKELDTLD